MMRDVRRPPSVASSCTCRGGCSQPEANIARSAAISRSNGRASRVAVASKSCIASTIVDKPPGSVSSWSWTVSGNGRSAAAGSFAIAQPTPRQPGQGDILQADADRFEDRDVAVVTSPRRCSGDQVGELHQLSAAKAGRVRENQITSLLQG